MSNESTDPSSTSSRGLHTVGGVVIDFLLAVRSSFLRFVAVVGVLMFLAAVVLNSLQYYGAIAGILGIFGVSLVVYAGIGIVVARMIGYS